MLFSSILLPFVFAFAILATTFVVIVVVVAIRKAHRHINLLLNHQCLPRILRWIDIHLDMLAAFDLLLDRMELGRARSINISVGLFTIPVAFVSEFIGSLIKMHWLLIFCVIFNFAVILILHLIVLRLLIDNLFLLSLRTFVYLVNIYLLVLNLLLHLHHFYRLFLFVYLSRNLLFLLLFLASLYPRFTRHRLAMG